MSFGPKLSAPPAIRSQSQAEAMSSSTSSYPAVAASAAEAEIVLKIRNKTAQLTVLRRAISVFDYFTLAAVRLLGEVSITWWRELGCWALSKGAAEQVISGSPLTFVPATTPVAPSHFASAARASRMRSERCRDRLLQLIEPGSGNGMD